MQNSEFGVQGSELKAEAGDGGGENKFEKDIDNQTVRRDFTAMQFEWDVPKAEANFAKHRISFAMATVVFEDPAHFTYDDVRHDYGELRQNTVGKMNECLVVCATHTDRAGVTRLISARPASRKERKKYHEQNNPTHL